MNLAGKRILITGAAKRVGKAMALAVAHAGGDVVLHYGRSKAAAEQTTAEIRAGGGQVEILSADLSDAKHTQALIAAASAQGPLYGLVNNASIFQPLNWQNTSLEAWERHIRVNLTAPFLLSQAFAQQIPAEAKGRIVNILDWRALRPGTDHLPYTISKAGLAALTRSLAAALAPRITVNGLAFGAILPPADSGDTGRILEHVPAGRWANLDEVGQALLFLLDGPAYVTGEIIHLDGGRHLV